MSIAYQTIREIEKRLLERINRLDNPVGLTLRVLAKIVQKRAQIARNENLKPEQID